MKTLSICKRYFKKIGCMGLAVLLSLLPLPSVTSGSEEAELDLLVERDADWIDEDPIGATMIKLNGHYYRVFHGIYDWNAAKEKCEEYGGHLATITSAEEQEAISQLPLQDGWEYWIGGQFDPTDGWKWVTREQWGYTDWLSGSEPEGGYLQIDTEDALCWVSCSDVPEGYLKIGFLCEWESDFSYNSFRLNFGPDYKVFGGSAVFNGHSYFVFEQIPNDDWYLAQSMCSEMGGHLATITSREEDEFVYSLMQEKSAGIYALGGADTEEEGTWEWVTGEEWDYTNWSAAQPDNGGYHGQDFLCYYSSVSSVEVEEGKWDDYDPRDSYMLRGFVCEWEGVYDTQYKFERNVFTFQGNRYGIYDRGQTWAQARKECQSLGGHLATITSAEEQAVIQYMLRINKKNSYWIGGRKLDDGWSWITNEDWDYEHWGYLQPDGGLAGMEEDKLMIYNAAREGLGIVPGDWNDLCNEGTFGDEEFFGWNNFGFICEWEGGTEVYEEIEEEPIPVRYVDIKVDSYEIEVGQQIQIEYEIFPEDATDQRVTWEVEDWQGAEEVACSIAADGVVTGLFEGVAFVTVTTVDGEHTDSCFVAINPSVDGGEQGGSTSGNEGDSYSSNEGDSSSGNEGGTEGTSGTEVGTDSPDGTGGDTSTAPGSEVSTEVSSDATQQAGTSQESSQQGTASAVSIVLRAEPVLLVGESDAIRADLSPSSPGLSVEWSSSDPTVLEVSDDGKVTAKGKGTATITAKSTGNPDVSVSKEIMVVAEGDQIEVSGGGRASYCAAKDLETGSLAAEYESSGDRGASSLAIPDSVTLNGRNIKIVSIGSRACAKSKKLRSVMIGKNVRSIGAKAFYKCKKLKRIQIKGTTLHDSDVDQSSFKKIRKKAKFLVPSGYGQSYTWLKNKGAKKAKIVQG